LKNRHIDAPELKQEGGKEAKRELTLVFLFCEGFNSKQN